MQRLFSSFPNGRPGVGLLLLRIATAAALVIQSRGSFEGTLANVALGSLAIISATLLVSGLVTPIAGTIGGIAAVMTAGAWPVNLLLIIAAVVLLGPGAYSVDARLFGRREIVITGSRPPG